MDFKELAKKRFSVRNFSNRPVEQEKLDKMLEMLLLAPTAKNQQPERVYVLQSEEILAKLDELTPLSLRMLPSCYFSPTMKVRSGNIPPRKVCIPVSKT